MTKSIFTLTIAGLFFALTSCNNPLNKKYNEDNLDKDLKEIVESKKADTTDMVYIAMYIMRAKMLGEKLEGKSYNDILENAKELRKEAEKEEAEAKALAEKAAKEEQEKREMFARILTVALYDKGYYKDDWEDYLTYEVAYENKCDKDIRAVKGSLLITDLFDQEIKTINLVEDEGIPAGKIIKKSYTTNYNQFMDEDTRLRSKSIKDIKVVWIPEKIIFGDGTTLE
jgi:hypothetical protein